MQHLKQQGLLSRAKPNSLPALLCGLGYAFWSRLPGRSLRRASGLRLIALLAGALACNGTPGGVVQRERIVLIVIDTLRRDFLALHGGPAHTPHIDALAARGIAAGARASFHQTSMSMAALFTGRTPSIESSTSERPLMWSPNTWCGLARLAEPGDEACLPSGVRTLGVQMRERGYHTVAVVSNPYLFRPAGFDRGFDAWVEIGKSNGPRRTVAPLVAARRRDSAHVNRAVERLLPQLPEGPLFLYVHYLDVHDWQILGISYVEAVERADAAVRELLALLESHGLLEDAAVVLTSDHGESLGEEHVVKGLPNHAGNPSFETVLDVPLILVGVEDAGRGARLRTEDLFYLLGRLAGSPPAASRDLDPDELLLSEGFFRTYRKGRYKSFRARADDTLILIDLEADPAERRNVADEHPEVAAAHRARVDALSHSLAAPNAMTVPASSQMLDRLRQLGYLK